MIGRVGACRPGLVDRLKKIAMARMPTAMTNCRLCYVVADN
jgi:hypothetical protein